MTDHVHGLVYHSELSLEEIKALRAGAYEAILAKWNEVFSNIGEPDIRIASPKVDLGLTNEIFAWTSGASVDAYTSYVSQTVPDNKLMLPFEIHDPERVLTGAKLLDHLSLPLEQADGLELARDQESPVYFWENTHFYKGDGTQAVNIHLRSDKATYATRAPVGILVAEVKGTTIKTGA